MRFAALILLIALPLRAQQEADEGWVLEETGSTIIDDSASGSEQSLFWADSQRQMLIRFCLRLKLRARPLTHGIVYTRHLRHLPTGKLAVVDQGAGYLPIDGSFALKTLPGGAYFPITVSAYLDGRSAVVRPLEKEMTCREVKRDAALHDLKRVVPLEAPRFSEMLVGELWQVPLTLRLGAGLSAVVPAGAVQATVSIGFSEQGSASVTLYRLAPDVLRLRLRLDRAEVMSAGGELIATLPIAELGLPLAEAVLRRAFPPDTAAQINAFLGPRIGGGALHRRGRRAMLEYLLDPRDTAQMEALAALLKGDLDSLMKLAAFAPKALFDEEAARHGLAKLAEKHEALGEPSFTGTVSYRDAERSLDLGIPLLFDRQAAWHRGQDQLVVLDGEGGQYTVEHRSRSRASGFIGMPGMGHLNERRSQRIAQSIVYQDAQGMSQAPSAVYIQQQSFLEQTSRKTEGQVKKINEILELIGGQRALPISDLFPSAEPDTETDDVYFSPPSDRWGIFSFTLLFTQKAVESILAAVPAAVQRAWQLAGRKGKASDLIADLEEARALEEPQAQGELLTKILAGKGRCRLAYEEIVKVLVQLADPLDLAAEFFIQIDRGPGDGPDLLARYSLHRGAGHDSFFDGIRQLKARFASPSLLGD